MGIIGMRTFVRALESITIEEVLDYFDRVAKFASAAHLGVGSNLDLFGYDKMPAKENEQLRSGNKDTYAFGEKSMPKTQIIRNEGCSTLRLV
jgi:membrane dipeptidase